VYRLHKHCIRRGWFADYMTSELVTGSKSN